MERELLESIDNQTLRQFQIRFSTYIARKFKSRGQHHLNNPDYNSTVHVLLEHAYRAKKHEIVDFLLSRINLDSKIDAFLSFISGEIGSGGLAYDVLIKGGLLGSPFSKQHLLDRINEDFNNSTDPEVLFINLGKFIETHIRFLEGHGPTVPGEGQFIHDLFDIIKIYMAKSEARGIFQTAAQRGAQITKEQGMYQNIREMLTKWEREKRERREAQGY